MNRDLLPATIMEMDMDRRLFLKLAGIAPFAPVVAKAAPVPAVHHEIGKRIIVGSNVAPLLKSMVETKEVMVANVLTNFWKNHEIPTADMYDHKKINDAVKKIMRG